MTHFYTNFDVKRLKGYLEQLKLSLKLYDVEEIGAIYAGRPDTPATLSPAQRWMAQKNPQSFRIVALDPADVTPNGSLCIQKSLTNPTLASSTDYVQAVGVAFLLAQYRLKRPVLVLDADNAVRQVVDEADFSNYGHYSLFVTAGPVQQPNAADCSAWAGNMRLVNGGFRLLRVAYGSFTQSLQEFRAASQFAGATLLLVDRTGARTAIVQRAVI